MIYLVILVVASSLAIGRLWLMQRKQRSHLQTVDGFWNSLECLSEDPAPRQQRPESPVVRRARRARGTLSEAPDRPQPIDPARRQAAKKRIEARRRAMRSHSAS